MEKKFCNNDEFILTVAKFGNETRLLETVMQPVTIDEILEDCEDHYQGFMRMDRTTFKGEDVTEDVAKAWLAANPTDIDDIRRTPDFVVDSSAWDDYCEDWETATNDHSEMQLQGVA